MVHLGVGLRLHRPEQDIRRLVLRRQVPFGCALLDLSWHLCLLGLVQNLPVQHQHLYSQVPHGGPILLLGRHLRLLGCLDDLPI